MDGWPTDINVYANRLYIASEKGVEELGYNWQSKVLDVSSRFYIWKKYAYKVSANDHHRLAIAAGQNGVITAAPGKGKISEREDIYLLEEDSHDCEWVGQNLIANSLECSFISTFEKLPTRPIGNPPQSYWRNLKIAKIRPVKTQKIENKDQKTVVYAWVAGQKLFSLLDTGELSIERTNQSDATNSPIEQIDSLDICFEIGKEFSGTEKILAARSGLFGTVLEIDDHLCVVTENGTQTVATRPVGWRVFPRAKQYLNHLHIVMNDHLSIRAYFPFENLGHKNRFGIDVEEVASNEG